MQKILSLETIYNDSIELTPLQKLRTCKITKDGKYIVYEGKAYFTRTGEQVPLNEEWTLSDILHTGADILSAGMDFVIPGSGAIVDILNAISYVIEAQFKTDEEKDSLYLMAVVTFGFVVLPGPLQAVGSSLKRFLGGKVSVATPSMLSALGVVYKFLDKILGGALQWIQFAFNSPLAQRILKKFSKQSIIGYFNTFKKRIKDILSKLLPTSVKEVRKKALENWQKSRLNSFVKNGFKVKNSRLLLKKLGFVEGKNYKITLKNKDYMVRIKSIKGDMVTLDNVKSLNVNGTYRGGPLHVDDFSKYAIGEPVKTFTRQGAGVMVPLFVKRLTDFLDDNGVIDPSKFTLFPDLNPEETSVETGALVNYEGETGQYNVNTTVKTFQQGLMLLGSKLTGNDDGKFGPSTKSALENFQKQNGLQSSLGKMDRATAKKLAEVLMTRKPKGQFKYEDVANGLNQL